MSGSARNLEITNELMDYDVLTKAVTLDEVKAAARKWLSAKPIIGIAQTGSDLSPCNRHHLVLAQRVREGLVLGSQATIALLPGKNVGIFIAANSEDSVLSAARLGRINDHLRGYIDAGKLGGTLTLSGKTQPLLSAWMDGDKLGFSFYIRAGWDPDRFARYVAGEIEYDLRPASIRRRLIPAFAAP